MLDLRTPFLALGPPPAQVGGPVIVSAMEIPGHASYRIARDLEGRALLLATVDPHSPPVPSPVLLEHLRLDPARPCQIRHTDGRKETGWFTVVMCLSLDLTLRDHFLLVAGMLVETLGSGSARAAIASGFGAMVELFRALQQPARKSTQGLWAEVFTIAQASRPDTLVDAWHALPGDRYDFSRGAERVEVKSSGGKEREHHFSLEQLHPPPGTHVLVASLFTQRAGGGVPLAELLGEVRGRIASRPDLMLRMEMVVAATLGSALEAGLRERFDRQVAEQTLAFYPVDRVPKLAPEIPRGVSEVRFRSDLGGVAPIELGTAARGDPESIFHAMTRALRG